MRYLFRDKSYTRLFTFKSSVQAITILRFLSILFLNLALVNFTEGCFSANASNSGKNFVATTSTLALGLDFNINDNFSKPTFPPPTISTLMLCSFKKIGYNSFLSIITLFQRQQILHRILLTDYFL